MPKIRLKGNRVLFSDVFNATASVSPPSLATNTQATATVTLNGVALGDYVVVSAPYDLQGIALTAYVSAANTVTLLFRNGTAGTIALASGTYNIKVLRG